MIEIETSQTLDAMLHQILNQALVAVNAEAGSLMMVANKRGILQIKARLGKPRPGRKTEPVYKISDKGIAGWVVLNREAYLCGDIENDTIFTPSLSGERNFLSVLVAPIVFEDKVLAVINADSEKKNYFTDEHKKILEIVAQEVAGPIAERISILDALAEAGVELSRLPSEGGVDRVLQRIAQLAVRSLGADVVTIYPYVQETDEFLVEGSGPTIAPAVRDTRFMRRKVYPNDVPWTVVKKRKPGFYPDVYKEEFLTGEVNRPDDPPRSRFVEREGIKSMAALLLPYRAAEDETEEVVGVMFANYRTFHDFNIDEISALATFADYAAIAILNVRHEEKRRVEQMKMVESISANFAHRMSNLAGISRVNVQMLKERINPDDLYSHQLLDDINRKAKILLELAGRLTRPFKTTGKMIELVPIDVEKIIKDELAQIPLTLDKISVNLKFPTYLPSVYSVEFQLRQVFHDMFSNALTAMQKEEKGFFEVCAVFNEPRSRVEISISDSGSGIPEEIREKLFNPGVTTKHDSLGIGLWWCRTFLQATGGNVTLKDTQVGKGTTFIIEIPCKSDTLLIENPLLYGASQTKEIDVLVVDDADDWRNRLAGIVITKNYTCCVTANYEETIETLAKNRFKLVVLDIRLVDSDPENKDGLRILAEIDKANLDTKVIIISGYGYGTDEVIKIAQQSQRFMGFIDKGQFELNDFYTLVYQIVGSPTVS